jgi:dTDP-glucose 4,6-dehydratase
MEFKKINKNKFNKIFITGGAGFIGSHVSEAFFNNFEGSEIIILDKLTYAGNKKFLSSIINSKRVKFIKGDILEINKYKKFLKNCDLAVNIAAESHVDNSFLSPLNFAKNNTLGAHTFFLECIKNNVKKILHMSTDEVYGEKTSGSANEKQTLNPTNPYSASKAAAELLINSYKYTYKKEILIVRANNIYGIRQYPEKLISRSIVNLIRNKPMTVHGNGKNIRFYLSANDLANALVILVKKKNNGIYNIGSSFCEKNINIVKKICKLLNKDPKKFVIYTKDRLYNDKRYSISSKKIMRLGWKPKSNLMEDLPTMVKWYQNNYKNFKKK